MNWYKIAQQGQFDFMKSPPLGTTTPLYDPDKFHIECRELDEEVERCTNLSELQSVLQHCGVKDAEETKFPNGKIVYLIIYNKISYLITGIESNAYRLEGADDWINNVVARGTVYDYFTPADFNKEFWDGVSLGYKLYHGTTEDKVSSIKKRGLQPSDETRSLTNRSTGAAVFTSDTPETAKYYYDVVIEIDVGAMRKDGYMPQVSREEPIEEAELIEALAHKIGIEDYSYEPEQGLDPGTLIFYGAIPPKYLKVME
jgi:hypothetical protein